MKISGVWPRMQRSQPWKVNASQAWGAIMAAKRHSKESIIRTLQNLAANLGKTRLSKTEVQRVLPVSSVRDHFGSLGKGLEAAGLQSGSSMAHLNDVRHVLCEEDLFASIQTLEQQLGHEPAQMNMQRKASSQLDRSRSDSGQNGPIRSLTIGNGRPSAARCRRA